MSESAKLRWGRYNYERYLGSEHFLAVGATGSGKTIIINMLMRSVLKATGSGRSLVYDPKLEVLPNVYAWADYDINRVKVLHPFDDRGCAWDLAKDIDDPLSARQFASILVPEGEHSGGGAESFFDAAVRDLLTGVLLAFVECVPNPRSWTFRDVILTMLYKPYMDCIFELQATRDGRPFPTLSRLRESYLEGDPKTNSNIRASISSKLGLFETVAAAWHHAQTRKDDKPQRQFSLTDWLADDCQDILVLGNDEASRAVIDPINRAIFRRATELLLAKREATQEEKSVGGNQTWFFLDEVREAGRLDGLSRLLTKGRSKGACVVLGFQDIDGMKDAYGEEVAQEICGQCGNIIVLKLTSPSTAEWAVQLFGEVIVQAKSGGSGFDSEGKVNFSKNTSDEVRSVLQTADFLYLPKTSQENGLTGVYKSPVNSPKDKLKIPATWDYLIEHCPEMKGTAYTHEILGRFIPKSNTFRYLEPWNEEDWQRLGFKGAVPNWKNQSSVAEHAQALVRRKVKVGE